MQHEKSCGAVIFINKGNKIEYLIIQQNINIYWGYPKGHLIENESEEIAALREIKEETGLDVTLIPKFRHKIEYKPRPDILKEVIFFIGEAKDKNVKIDTQEIKSYQWVSYDEGIKKVTHVVSKELLKEANNYILKVKNKL